MKIDKLMAGGILAATLAMVLYITDVVLSKPTDEPQLHSATIRLHDSTGRFFCSGVVVSDTMALTAAHCITQVVGFFQLALSTEPIQVHTEQGNDSYVVATALKASPRADVGIITGDFKNFKKAKVNTNAASNAKSWQSSVKACGFPYGAGLSCVKVTANVKYFFFWSSEDGSLYPGMSGGPVFNSAGEVIGVNSAVSQTHNIFAPIVEIEAMFGVKL